MKLSRVFRFSLRAFLLVLTIACVVFGIVATQARQQETAIAWVQKNGGKVYDWDFTHRAPNRRLSVPPFLQWLMGEHYFLHVNLVEFNKVKLDDLSRLQSFPELEQLHLEQCRLRDLRALSELRQLKELYLNGNAITDLSPLSNLAALEVLYVANNHVSDLAPLTSLTRLKWLRVDNNLIRDVQPLETLVDLASVDLSGNEIADCLPLQSLVNLQFVELTDNRIPAEQLGRLRASLPNLASWNGVRVKDPANARFYGRRQ